MALFPVLLALFLLWKTKSRTKELNDKFRRRFGPNSQFDQDHPGVNQFSLQALALTLILLLYAVQTFARKFIITESALSGTGNHLVALCYVAVMLTGPGILNTIIIPWLYLLGDRRIRGGLKGWIRTWRGNTNQSLYM